MKARRVVLSVLAGLALAAAGGAQAQAFPPYVKKTNARGTVRICGDMQGGLVSKFEAAFIKHHPNVRFVDIPGASQVAAACMVLGFGDLGIAGAPIDPGQLYLLNKVSDGRKAVEISIAGGSYDVRGRSAVLAVYVHKSNPIEKLTVGQLQGIFGEQRNAGWKDFLWDDAQARGPEENLRTWDQLGLKGEWAGRQIHTYGLSWSGPLTFMNRLLTGDSGKWNPTQKSYNIEGFAKGKALTSQMVADMAADPAAIGWTQMIFAAHEPNLKPIPIAWTEAGPYLLPSKESMANRTYPLNRDIYFYARVPMDKVESEFLRFVLSGEGQKLIADQGVFSPLTPQAVAEQLKKLE